MFNSFLERAWVSEYCTLNAVVASSGKISLTASPLSKCVSRFEWRLPSLVIVRGERSIGSSIIQIKIKTVLISIGLIRELADSRPPDVCYRHGQVMDILSHSVRLCPRV
jgi:hypothetical protein